MKKKGVLYGVGVGPGDPELLTLKAYRILEQCPVIAAPGRIPEETVAYRIAAAACPSLEEKERTGIEMPMTKDREVLERSHREPEERLAALLEEGRDVAFLTLGDPCVYSTYFYLHRRLQKRGYEARIISGIPSFCAAAARLDLTLGEKAEQIHVIPASYQVREILKEEEARGARIMGVENCGMPGERFFRGAEELREDAGYYTLIFVKEGEGQ